MQNMLQHMFKEQYHDDPLIQANIVQLGWAIKRLMDQYEIMAFDDFDMYAERIYNEVDYQAASNGILKNTK